MGLFRRRVGDQEIPDEHKFNVASYGSVVDLVRELGDTAVDKFLTDISPHLDAIQRHERDAAEQLGRVLHTHAISAVILIESGGIEKFNAKARASSEASTGMTAPQVIAEVDRLV